MDHHVIVLGISEIGQQTWRIVVERPTGYRASAGQAAEVALDEAGWWDKPRPFHFRRIDSDDMLEFVLRINEGDEDPVMRRLAKMKKGDPVVISAPLAETFADIYFGGWRRPAHRRAVRPAATARERAAS